MQRYKLTVAYDGTNYSGFQVQPNVPTIQGELEQALQRIAKGEFVRIHGAGRTDAGVHAAGQVCHFDFPFYISEEGMLRAINANTPSDIVPQKVERVSDTFHARYDACGKMYEYRLYTGKQADPFKRLYAYHHPHSLNVERIKQALEHFKGEHDFTSFSAVNAEVDSRVREIYEACLIQEGTDYILRFSGSGFLYNMIRIMVGTLLDVSDGKLDPYAISDILQAKERQAASRTASPVGLKMVEVYYKDEE